MALKCRRRHYNLLMSSYMVPDLNQIWIFSKDFFSLLKCSNIKFHGYPCSASRASACGETDRKAECIDNFYKHICLLGTVLCSFPSDVKKVRKIPRQAFHVT